MLWINGKMTDLTKKDAIHKLVDAKCFLERYSNPHDKWTEAINIGIEAIEIVMDQEEQEPTTKNDLGVDCISRAEAIKCLECDFDITGKENMKTVVNYINSAHDKIVNLPRVKQEPFKPMVEIDLYSVIKQKYIEREVLDKIREQIKSNLRGVEIALEVLVENHPLRPKMEGAKDTLEDCLELIDKAETEET